MITTKRQIGEQAGLTEIICTENRAEAEAKADEAIKIYGADRVFISQADTYMTVHIDDDKIMNEIMEDAKNHIVWIK